MATTITSSPHPMSHANTIPNPSPSSQAKDDITLSSSYPGAIKPIQMLQLQRQHVLDAHSGESATTAAFFNCTVPKKSAPAAPLHHSLELHDQISLSSASAPTHINSNWRVSPLKNNWRELPQSADIPARMPDDQTMDLCKIEDKRHQGRVKWYNQQKKYGFIISQDCKEYFVHRDDLQPSTHIQEPHLITGEYVEYEPTPTQDGRLKASNVSGIQRGPLMCDHGLR